MADNGVRDSETEEYEGKYLIVRGDKGGFLDLWRFLFWSSSPHMFLEGSSSPPANANWWLRSRDRRWVIVVSIIVRKIIALFRKPMACIGVAVEFAFNLVAQNGGVLGLLINTVRGKCLVPQRDSDAFASIIGLLDPRVELCKDFSRLTWPTDEIDINTMIRSRGFMDLCIMASKLAYENEKVVKRIVVDHWKMHFVKFFNCWNEYHKAMSTQVFVICDKAVEANLILVSFRGTEPFDSDDWVTDFDYSWYEIPQVGKVHMGFLEALGLGNREEPSSFRFHLDAKNHSSRNSTETLTEEDKMSAYYSVKTLLKVLFNEHKNAKFIVTGHSLGGALAILFPMLLLFYEDGALMERLLAVYTFGQPRVGNEQLGDYMEAHICQPVPKYFRLVYCNDLVPRIPYDDKTFLFKHFGLCIYYNSFYIEKDTKEEPNKNYFGLRGAILAHLNAVWELFRALAMTYLYGPEFSEGWFSVMLRFFGLAMPSISEHCPSNYVNSVRLGKRLVQSQIS